MEPPPPTKFDTSEFLKVFFSILFLSVCLFVLMMYRHRFFGYVVQTVLRYCFLPSTSRIHLGGLVICPLSCRMFFQNFFYQDENMTLRIVDGYISFVFWDSWFGDPLWTKVCEPMLTDNLKGVSCMVKVKLKWVQGIVVDVDRQKKKLRVRLDNGDTTTSRVVSDPAVEDENPTNVGVGVGTHEMTNMGDNIKGITESNASEAAGHRHRRSSHSCHSEKPHRTALPQQRETKLPTGPPSVPRGRMSLGSESLDNSANVRASEYSKACSSFSEVHVEQQAEPGSDNSDVVKLIDMHMVRIQQKRGKLRIHLNGMGLTFYNATGNYKDPDIPERSGKQKKSGLVASITKKFRSITRHNSRKTDSNSTTHNSPQPQTLGTEREVVDLLEDSDATDMPTNRERILAELQQQRKKNSKCFLQRFYDFIGSIELELFTSYINIGGANAKHPYFLHVGFERGEGITYLTLEDVLSVDLYRLVSEGTLEKFSARWYPMKPGKESVPARSVWNTWRDSFLYTCGDIPPEDRPEPIPDDPSVLLEDYGIIMGNEEDSTVHFTLYRDFPNVYAGEEITSLSDLPRSGVELLIDAPELCYGSWSNFSVMELKEHFIPNTYRSVEPLKFQFGQQRPYGNFEVYVELLRETSLVVPFKRKTVAPTPPFGLCDSGRKGIVVVTLGRGSTYVQKFNAPLPHEEGQSMESLLTGLGVWVTTNAVQEESAVLLHAEKVELFTDTLSGLVYNGRKLWNILPSMENSEVWWHMDYISFFMDLGFDWQFVPYMYHGKKFTTEEYNTYRVFVDEFIPNVKRFEVILTGNFKLYLSGNAHNVVYSEDINDMDANIFLIVHTKTGGRLFMTLPNDAYLLSSVTEVRRPFEVSLMDADLLLALPQSHPLHELVESSTPFCGVTEFTLNGVYVANIPNQTVPQDRNPVSHETGRTTLRNFLDCELKISGIRGHLMAPHIATLRELIENLFGSSSCVVRPSELFWPLSKIHPKINRPKNVRSMFHRYLQKDEPPPNDVDFNVAINVVDVDVTLREGGAKSPQVNLRFGSLSFTMMSQAGVTDFSLAISPIYGRLMDFSTGEFSRDTFVCCGNVTLNILRHFGPAPLRTLFYSASEGRANSISFHVTVEQVAMLTELFTTLQKQFFMWDEGLFGEIEKARTAAVYSADNCVLTSPVQMKKHRMAAEGRLHSDHKYAHETSQAFQPSNKENKKSDVRKALTRILTRGEAFMKVPFSEVVPTAVAGKFQEYLDLLSEYEDYAKDYAVHTMLLSIPLVKGYVAVGSDNYFEVKLPAGLRATSTTKNDLNSNTRSTVALRSLTLCGYSRRSIKDDGVSAETFAEVFRLETSLQVRQYIAYPFDKGLDFHRRKQQRFILEHDVFRLFTSQTTCGQRSSSRSDGMSHVKVGTDDTHSSSMLRDDGHEEKDGEDGMTERSKEKTEKEYLTEGVMNRLPVYNQDGTKGEDSKESIRGDELPGLDITGVPEDAKVSTQLQQQQQQLVEEKDSNKDVDPSGGNASTPINTLKAAIKNTNSPSRSERSAATTTSRNETIRFATCLSASDDASSFSDEDDVNDLGESSNECEYDANSHDPFVNNESSSCLSRTFIDDGALGAHMEENVLPTVTSDEGESDPKSKKYKPINSTHFLRHVTLDMSNMLQGSLYEYSATMRSKRSNIRDRTCFHASLPAIKFTPSKQSASGTSTRMLQQTFDAPDASGGCEQKRGATSVEDAAQMWAMRAADNRKRSRDGSTSKQVHVEFETPLAFFLSQDFIEGLLFEVNSALQHVFDDGLHHTSPNEANPMAVFPFSVPAMKHVRQQSGLKGMRDLIKSSTSHIEKAKKKLVARTQPSRSRAHQKRWYSEVDILSVVIPSIRASIITDLPLPLNNTAHVSQVNGVYTTLFCMRSVQLVTQKIVPPSRATRKAEANTVSVSATFSSCAVITQIEHEPLLRNENLRVKVPGIHYNEAKDTLAVIYFTSLCGRVQHQATQGVLSGIYHLTMDTAAFHATRDFICYIKSMTALWRRLSDAWCVQPYAHWRHERVLTESWECQNEVSGSSAAMLRPSNPHECMDSTATTMQNYGIEESRVFQGVGAIRMVRVEIMDVCREGCYMHVDTRRPCVAEVSCPQTKFVMRVPIKPQTQSLPAATRPHAQRNTSVTLSSGEICGCYQQAVEWQRRAPNLRTVRVQFIGNVESVTVKCFPTLLHILKVLRSDADVTTPPVELMPDIRSPTEEDAAFAMDGPGFSWPYSSGMSNVANSIVFRGSFSLGKVDVCMIQSEMNLLQVKGTGLKGFGETHAEAVSSRECVKTHTLNGAFSEHVVQKLRAWANRARAQAPRGQYAVLPSVSPQLHLKNSMFFTAETMQVQYVADVVIPCAESFGAFEYVETDKRTHRQDPRLFVVTAKQLRADIYHADQDDNHSGSKLLEKSPDNTEHPTGEHGANEQFNVQVDITNVVLFLPYRPKAVEIVQPQLQRWVDDWLEPTILRSMRTTPTTLNEGHHPSGKPLKGGKLYAYCCAVRVRGTLLQNNLPQDMNLDLSIPLASLFLNASSDRKLALRAHLHPSRLLSFSPTVGKHTMDLPNIFAVYNSDRLRCSGMCLVETVEVTVSPIIISHLIFLFYRVMAVRSIFMKIFKLDQRESLDVQQSGGGSTACHSGHRSNFMLLVGGLRVSYLTSMTNMHLSVCRLKGRNYSAAGSEKSNSHTVLKVANVQIALVDRDGYDQLQTFLCQSDYLQKCRTEPGPTKPKEELGSTSFSSAVEQEVKPATCALNGFIWGLFETSLTLSTGRSDTNELHPALKNISTGTPRGPLDIRSLTNVGVTATRWNATIFSPLIVARIGLAQLLKRSIDEAKELSEAMRRAAERENRKVHRQLTKSVVYQQLARAERRESEVKLNTQRQRIERIMELTSQMAPGQILTNQRRSSLVPPAEPNCVGVAESGKFQTTADHKLFVTMSNFMVVVPFGDAPYRSLLEGVSLATHRGRPKELLLNRKDFIPTMAMKIKVENSTFVCRLHKSQQCVPLHSKTPLTMRGDSISGLLGTMKLDGGAKRSVTSKFVLSDAHFYCSDGSPIGVDDSAKGLLSKTHVLGGLGTLTSPSKEEYRNSLSKISFASIEVPLNINESGRCVNFGAVMDISSPQITISTRLASVLSQFSNEISTKSLSAFFQRHETKLGARAGKGATSVGPSEATRSPQLSEGCYQDPARGRKRRSVFADPETPSVGTPQQAEVMPLLCNFDITARWEAGDIYVYSIQRDTSPNSAPTSQHTGGTANRLPRQQPRRRARHASDGSDPTMGSADGPGALNNEAARKTMSVLLNIPFPEVTATIMGCHGGDVTNQERFIARVEIRENTIEIDPSIISLAHEIEEWEAIHVRDNADRIANVLKLVNTWERDNYNRRLVQYSSVADMALPMPRAFFSVLLNLEMKERSAASRLGRSRRRSSARRSACLLPIEKDHQPQQKIPVVHAGSTNSKQKLLSVQIRVTEFRLVLTTEPASTVNFTLSLDERVGSVDFFVKRTHPQSTMWVKDVQAHPPPAVLLLLCVRRLRVECQAKMEVKALEMCLEEMEVQAALRHCNKALVLTNVCIYLPRSASSSGKMELTVRVPYLWQLFIFEAQWHRSLLESLQSVNRIFERGATIFKEKMTMHSSIQQQSQCMKPNPQSLIIAFTGSHGNIRVDLGSGNAHLLGMGNMSGSLVVARRDIGKMQVFVDASVRSVVLRSEGVLSGTARLDTLYLKGFSVRNGDELQGDVVRSPEGRTFRYMLCAYKSHATFKQRQLRDLFECQVGELTVNFMDSMGDGASTSVRMEVFLNRSNVVVTPSTVPTLVHTVTDWGNIVVAQRKIASTKLVCSAAGTPHSPSGSGKVRKNVADASTHRGGEAVDPVAKGKPSPTGKISATHTRETSTYEAEEGSARKDTGSSGGESAQYLPFMANKLTRIPYGLIQIEVNHSSLFLGGTSGVAEKSGCIVSSVPHAVLKFAECPADDGAAVKRVLEVSTNNMEFYRPGTTKVLILGFHGVNKFEFYTRQLVGDNEVGYMMSLHQVNPWTGNPGLQDFQEVIQLVRSFKAPSKSNTFRDLSGTSDMWHTEVQAEVGTSVDSLPLGVEDTQLALLPISSENEDSSMGTAVVAYGDHAHTTTSSCDRRYNKARKVSDQRYLKPLSNVQFAPQLRFGGAVAVNVDVILNWFGVTRDMLPHLIHTKACDQLEAALRFLEEAASKQAEIVRAP